MTRPVRTSAVWLVALAAAACVWSAAARAAAAESEDVWFARVAFARWKRTGTLPDAANFADAESFIAAYRTAQESRREFSERFAAHATIGDTEPIDRLVASFTKAVLARKAAGTPK